MPEQNIIDVSNNNESYVDLLDRKNLAKNLLKVIKLQNANVYSINAPWGSGKTWFLKFLESECEEQNIPFVQFNVWETDYAKDPFQAILCELLELLNRQIEENNTQLQNILKSISSKANDLYNIMKRANYSIGLNAKIVSAEVTLNPDESTLNEYKEMKNRKKEFITELKNFVTQLNTKLIIAIDELDRCRPDYAITTLEIIKHFFNIDDVVFILAVDKEQLQRTVKTMFGMDTDTDAYLRKFVDIQYHLPKADLDNFVKYLVEYKYPLIKKVFERMVGDKYIDITNNEFTDYGGNYQKSLTTYINYFKNRDLSLRDIDKFSLKISLILALITNKDILLSLDFLLPLVALNTKYNDIYIKLKKWETMSIIQNDEWKKYIHKTSFRLVYSKMRETITTPKNIIHRYDVFDKYADNLSRYFSIIDYAEDFS